MQTIEIKQSTVPPVGIYEKCRDKFKVDFRKGVVFTVGDTIHAMRFPLPADLYEHEKTHVIQQSNYAGGWTAWWDRYLDDPYFRYTQEIEAYRNQYKYFCSQVRDRNTRAKFLYQITHQMMTMYGEIKVEASKVKSDISRNIC